VNCFSNETSARKREISQKDGIEHSQFEVVVLKPKARVLVCDSINVEGIRKLEEAGFQVVVPPFHEMA